MFGELKPRVSVALLAKGFSKVQCLKSASLEKTGFLRNPPSFSPDLPHPHLPLKCKEDKNRAPISGLESRKMTKKHLPWESSRSDGERSCGEDLVVSGVTAWWFSFEGELSSKTLQLPSI